MQKNPDKVILQRVDYISDLEEGYLSWNIIPFGKQEGYIIKDDFQTIGEENIISGKYLRTVIALSQEEVMIGNPLVIKGDALESVIQYNRFNKMKREEIDRRNPSINRTLPLSIEGIIELHGIDTNFTIFRKELAVFNKSFEPAIYEGQQKTPLFESVQQFFGTYF
jgi:hypothetical protein